MKQGLLEIDKFKKFSPIGAFIFAMASHAGQYRADNETPYIRHSFEVAKQLDDWGLKDDRYLIIALLHDVLEKTNATKDMLIEIFGEENFINEIVWGYKDIGAKAVPYFKKKHDTIYMYQKQSTDERVFNIQRQQL